ncbi:uncharacterized protein LOC126785716 [Argentina anserina]|uniref:uncharacterized protein LOC126785716 n=1 Tax=Argentina anserina TaxID=57926 RepID=UPI0021767AAC|nr:uncharacterized protein LOC126785716 [Potentilla anserina]
MYYYCLSTLPAFATVRPKPTSLSSNRAIPIRAMKAVVQRVASASVEMEGRTISSIGPGLLILVGLRITDSGSDAEYMSLECLWFLCTCCGLTVSQFTLYGFLKGNKPDFHVAMAPDKAKPFYSSLVESFRKSYKPDAVKGETFLL